MIGSIKADGVLESNLIGISSSFVVNVTNEPSKRCVRIDCDMFILFCVRIVSITGSNTPCKLSIFI